jgi:hypothetical protein
MSNHRVGPCEYSKFDHAVLSTMAELHTTMIDADPDIKNFVSSVKGGRWTNAINYLNKTARNDYSDDIRMFYQVAEQLATKSFSHMSFEYCLYRTDANSGDLIMPLFFGVTSSYKMSLNWGDHIKRVSIPGNVHVMFLEAFDVKNPDKLYEGEVLLPPGRIVMTSRETEAKAPNGDTVYISDAAYVPFTEKEALAYLKEFKVIKRVW